MMDESVEGVNIGQAPHPPHFFMTYLAWDELSFQVETVAEYHQYLMHYITFKLQEYQGREGEFDTLG